MAALYRLRPRWVEAAVEGVLGLDIGGSGVRGAVVDEGGRVGPIWRVSLSERGIDAVLAAVRELVRELGGARAVGVGMPGFIREGRVLASPNFPEWSDVPLREHLQRELGVPASVENDANAATWGAWVQRGRQGDLVLLTLGTGVGGGVITDGRLLRGSGGTGAEVGHIYISGDRACGCGGRGCLETWSSTVGLVRSASEAGHPVSTGLEVVQAADKGAPWALGILDQAADRLGQGLVTLVNLFNPDQILVAGGLSQASRHLAPRAEAWLRQHAIQASVQRVSIEWSGPADTLAISGAADLARQA